MRKLLPIILLAFSLSLPWMLSAQSGAVPSDKSSRLRRPIALVLAEQGKKLLIANRDSGTIATLDTQTLGVVGEKCVAGKLSDLTAGRDLLLATDDDAGELVLLDAQLRERRRLRVGVSPVGVRISPDGNLASIALLWPRRLAFVDLTAPDSAAVVLDLPFSPRRQVMVPGTTRLIVADAFAGKLAVVNYATKKIESVRSLAVHNIRDLALDRSNKTLLLTHQTLNAQGHTTSGEIRTSNVMTNNVRKFALADVLYPLAELSRDERVYQLGGVERGAGDPAEVTELADGQVLVTLGGVNEVAIGRPEKALWTHFEVGRRPSAVVVDDTNRRAFVANTFGDSISVIDLRKPGVEREISLGAPPADLRPEERGEMLFFDARLSFEAWYSCQSCHTDGHTTGRLNDNFSDGSFGTPKRILTLLGAKDTGPWAWNGQVADLETQVRTSVKSTMQGAAPSAETVRDLAAFVRTLAPPPSLRQARGAVDVEAQKRGRKIFTREKCASCHATPVYTSAKTYDVGLHDELGGKLFNPPSLRGISQAGPYFHDNRAATLEEVFTRFRHQVESPLSSQEASDLVYFLEGL